MRYGVKAVCVRIAGTLPSRWTGLEQGGGIGKGRKRWQWRRERMMERRKRREGYDGGSRDESVNTATQKMSERRTVEKI